jgi:hypothetical protein
MKRMIMTCCIVVGVFLGKSIMKGQRQDSPRSASYPTQTSSNASDSKLFTVAIQQDTISGMVYNDINRNGVNNLETGLPGWVVVLHSDSLTGPLVSSVVTDSTGHFSVVIGKGTFFLYEMQHLGWLLTQPAGVIYTIQNQTSGIVTFPNRDFGNFEYGTITIRLTEDVKGNGIIDPEDSLALPSGVQGIFLTMHGNTAVRIDTIGNGVKSITLHNLPTGIFSVTQIGVPPGWIKTYGLSPVRITTTGPSNSIAYLNFKTITVTGNIFNDLNLNGTNDGEAGLSGWTVRLHSDSLNRPVLKTAITDLDGNYEINGVTGGSYALEEVVPDPWSQTAPPSPGYYAFTASSGIDRTGYDFGNYRGASISGQIFNDRNKNGLQDPDEPGLTGWQLVASNANPLLTRSAFSQPGGSFTIFKLAGGTYTVSEIVKNGWTQSYPPGSSYTVTVNLGTDTSAFVFGNQAFQDSLKYRSFISDSFANKSVRKRVSVYAWRFTVQNLTGQTVDQLHVKFSYSGAVITGATVMPTIAPFSRTEWVFYGNTLPAGQTMEISGRSSIPGIKINQWWWVSGGQMVGVKQSRMGPSNLQALYPMPTVGNERDEVCLRGFWPFNASGNPGMIIGVERRDSARFYGWVLLRRTNDVKNSLLDKFGYHAGPPQGLTYYYGRPFTGQKSSIGPSKLNNRLVAELIALKLNIAASAYALTPPGFGELVYEDGGNPLSGKMIKQIAARADTALTFWRTQNASVYTNLDTTIRKINSSFVGAMDTVSYALGFALTGVRTVQSVDWLRPTPPGTLPVVINSSVMDVQEELPRQFVLYQNYPNPFNPATSIEYALPNPAYVSMKIYNMLGQEVAILLDREQMDEGNHTVDFNAGDYSSGVYFYRIIVEEVQAREENSFPNYFTAVKKMVLIK